MNAKITPELIGQQAEQLYGFTYDRSRCAELAREVERHNRAVLKALGALHFNDVPGRFTAVLSEHAERWKIRS